MNRRLRYNYLPTYKCPKCGAPSTIKELRYVYNGKVIYECRACGSILDPQDVEQKLNVKKEDK